MSEFHDPELRQQLGRLSGPYPDDNAAFAAWQRRVGQARRRRAVAWTTCAAMSLIIATVGVAALQNTGRHSIVPGESSDNSADVTLSVATTEPDESSTTESTAAKASAPVTLASDTTQSSEVVDTSMPETESTESSDSSGSGSSGNGSSGSSGTGGSQAATQMFTSTGGSITVRRDGDQLTLVGVSPASGFAADEKKRSGDRVEVTFTSTNHQSKISVTISGGAMDADISEDPGSSGNNDNTAPGDTSVGDGGDGSSGGDSD